jgi:hypothetical protein
MNFELTKEQRDFQRLVHDFVAQEVRPLARHVDETGEFNWQARARWSILRRTNSSRRGCQSWRRVRAGWAAWR